MITFAKYTSIVKNIAKKLKISKDQAVHALVKAQQEQKIDILKWQKYMTMIRHFALSVPAEYDPTLDERLMTSPQKLAQMQHYWDNLFHLATDEVKKKNMKMRFGIRNIKLDPRGKNKILSFDEDNDGADLPKVNP